MGGARLECAVDRVLPIARRRHDGRLDAVPGQRPRADTTCRERVLMEIVFVVAIAENSVIGAGDACRGD